MVMIGTRNDPRLDEFKAKMQRLSEEAERRFRGELAFADPVCPKHKAGRLDMQASEEKMLIIYDCEKCQAEEAEEKTLKYLARAGVPERVRGATFDNFKADHPKQRDTILEAKRFLAGAYQNFILTGKPGTGKGHIAAAIIRERNQPRDCWITVHAYLRLYHKAYADNSHDSVVNMLGQRPLLVLDEAFGNLPKDGEQALFELVDMRWNKRLRTIVLTNLTPSQLNSNWIGERASDRLREGAKQIWCEWPSYRTRDPHFALVHGTGI